MEGPLASVTEVECGLDTLPTYLRLLLEITASAASSWYFDVKSKSTMKYFEPTARDSTM